MAGFFQYHLRTTAVDAARSFYASVLESRPLVIVPLHEQALARGARPHWLGYIAVDDVDRTVSAFVSRGAAPLGAKWVDDDGLAAAVVRDPGGAIVAFAKPQASLAASRGDGNRGNGDRADGDRGDVVWHLLHTADVERAQRNYSEVFGWEFMPPVDRGPFGIFHPFAWQPGGDPVGALSDIAARPGVHPHWLFHMQVPALDRAVESVRAGGGRVAPAITLSGGKRVAVCDDPQVAAFAIVQGYDRPL